MPHFSLFLRLWTLSEAQCGLYGRAMESYTSHLHIAFCKPRPLQFRVSGKTERMRLMAVVASILLVRAVIVSVHRSLNSQKSMHI